MSESIRDLVVSVNLDIGNFKNNVAMLQNEIKNIGSGFDVAGAGVKDFESSVAGLEKKSETLTAKLTAQADIIRVLTTKYNDQANAVAKARENLANAQRAYDADPSKRNADILERQNNALAVSISKFAQYGAQLNDSVSAIRLTEQEIEKTNAALKMQEQGWNSYQSTIDSSKSKITELENQLRITNAEFERQVAHAGGDAFLQTAEGMNAKVYTLAQTMEMSTQIAAEYERQLGALQGQQTLAASVGDVAKVKELDTEINRVSVAFINAQKNASSTANALNQASNAVNANAKGYSSFAKGIDQNNKKLAALSKSLKDTDAKYKQLAYDMGMNGSFDSGIIGTIYNVQQLKEELKLNAETVGVLKEKLNSLLSQRNIADEVMGDPKKVKELNDQISKTEDELRNAQTEGSRLKSELNNLAGPATILSGIFTTIGSSLSTFGGAMTSVGSAMNMYVSRYAKQAVNEVRSSTLDFETAMASVRKAFMGSSESTIQDMADYAQRAAVTFGMSAAEIADTVAMVGQMGVSDTMFEPFTNAVLQLAMTTDMSASDIAKAMAQYANITKMPLDNVDRWGSTVEFLGVNMQTTEGDIIEMATALAAAGKQVNMTDAEILGMAATLSSLGVASQKGGTAFSKALIKMETAVEGYYSNDAKTKKKAEQQLAEFAELANMSVDEFLQAWKLKPTETFMAFIQGVANKDIENADLTAIGILNDLGFSEVRLRDTMMRTVNASDKMSEAMGYANRAWTENNALTGAANTLLNTTAKREDQVKAKAKNFAITLGNDLRPAYENILEQVSLYIDRMMEMDSKEREQVIVYGLLAAAAGPVLTMVGRLTKSIGGLITGFGTGIKSMSSFLANMHMVTGGASTMVIALVAVTAAIAIGIRKYNDYQRSLTATYRAQVKLNEATEKWGEDAVTAFEKAKGLQAFGFKNDVEFNITYGGGVSGAKNDGSTYGSAWLDGVVATWTDGKSETDEIIQNILTGAGFSDTDKDNILNSTIGSQEEREAAAADLEAINKRIEDILKNKKNRNLTEEEIKELDELYGRARTIQIKYKLTADSEGIDLDTFFNDIETGVAAAIARGASKDSVFSNAFSAIMSGYGDYTQQLDDEFDRRYAEIVGNSELSDEEKNAQIDELKAWYDYMGGEAGKALNEAIAKAIGESGLTFTKDDDVYGDTIDSLEQIAALVELINGGNRDGATFESIATLLDGLDESKFLEIQSALIALQSSVPEGMSFEEVYPEAAALLSTIEMLKDMGSGNFKFLLESEDGNTDLSDAFTHMFGNDNTEELVQIAATLDCESLENVYTAWAEGEHVSINASAKLTADSVDFWYEHSDPEEGAFGADSDHLDVKIASVTVIPDSMEVSVFDENGNPVEVKSLDIENMPDLVTDYALTGEDANGFVVPVASLSFQVENGHITGVKAWDANGLELGTLYGADGKELTLDDLVIKCNGLLNVSDIDVNEDTTIEVGVKPILLTDGTVPNLKYPTVSGSGSFLNSLYGLNRDETINDWLFGQYTVDNSFSDAMRKYLDYLTDPKMLGSGFSDNENAAFGKVITDYIENGIETIDGESIPVGELFQNLLFNDIDLSEQEPELAQEIYETLTNALAFVDPNGVGFNTAAGLSIQKMLWDMLGLNESLGEYDPTNDEDVQMLYENINARIESILNGYTPPEVTDGSGGNWWDSNFWFWNWFGSAEAEEFDTGDLTGSITGSVKDAVKEAQKSSEVTGAGDGIVSSLYDGINQYAQDNIGEVDFGLNEAFASALSNVTADGSIDLSGVKANGSTDIGKNIATGIASGIKNNVDIIQRAAREAAQAALTAAMGALGIHSPSRVFRDEVGVNISKGIAEGVMLENSNTAGVIQNAVKYMSDTAGSIAMRGNAYAGGTTVNRNYNDASSVNIYGDFQIRSDQDIKDLAREIAGLTNSANAARGMRG